MGDMHQDRRRSGGNYYPVYSSDEDETVNYVSRNAKSDKRAGRSSSFHDNTPRSSSTYRRKSLVGNNSSNSYLDRQAESKPGKPAGRDFDALYVPKTIITVAAGLAAGMFVAVLSVSLLQHGEKPPRLQGDYLLCSDYKEVNKSICIPDNDSYIVLDIVMTLQKNLSTEAALAECYPTLQNQANVSVSKVDKFTSQNDTNVSGRLLKKYVAWIIVANPSWNLRLYDKAGLEVNVLKYVVDMSWKIKSINPVKPLSCMVRQWTRYLWYSIWYIILGLLVALIGFYSYLWYVNKQRQRQQAVFVMVDKIIEVLISHYKSSLSNKDLLPYLAISHVRDMLIPPSERVRREYIWKKAVEWIATSESRVRVESQMIAGEQFNVWKWIHADPPATECPDKCEWQGKAFDAVSPPSSPPSLCMRLKNMFDSTIHMSPSDVIAIQNALLHKCKDYGRVVHIVVDKRSLFGCVYMKLNSMSSSLAIYRALHGSWFKGRLITAKYIAPERYHKWFPSAENAVRTIFPSDT